MKRKSSTSPPHDQFREPADAGLFRNIEPKQPVKPKSNRDQRRAARSVRRTVVRRPWRRGEHE